MELSILKLQEPASGRPMGERRRRIRHKLSSPVYASFDRPSTGMVLDLCELLDLSEEGFSVQTTGSLELNRNLNLSLDLPETKSFVHGSGLVVWSDRAGRTGIRFTGLPEPAQRLLKEWLFVNLMVACTRRAARSGQGSARVEQNLALLGPVPHADVFVPAADLSGALSAVDAVRREVRIAGDFEVALRRITERALTLTGASGAALAYLTDDKMICRASAGDPAMPLGTVVDVQQGITGECVRGGRMVACEDAESDERVDREVCRMLGIGSILATPIVSDFRVVGLLEVFSPLPRAFTEVHETVIDRLVELVPKAQPEPMLPLQDSDPKLTELPVARNIPAANASREALWEPERVAQEPLKGVPVRLTNILLLALTAAALALASGYLLAPRIEKLWLSKPASAGSPVSVPAGGTPAAAVRVTQATTFDDLRSLAERGDAYAQWMLGTRYHNGEGVPQDDAQAMRWFERAAEQGYPDAQATAGAYYWAGRGVPKDLIRAYFWSTLALKQGDSSMESRLQGLTLHMTPAQVAAAQSQADDWLRQKRAAK